MNRSARLVVFASLISLLGQASETEIESYEAEGIRILKELGGSLKKLRSLPQSTTTNATCPNEVDARIDYRQEKLLSIVKGLTKEQLGAALGEPDYITTDGHSWTYFFTSPRAPFQVGGGFPELTFSFTANGGLNNVICHYSR